MLYKNLTTGESENRTALRRTLGPGTGVLFKTSKALSIPNKVLNQTSDQDIHILFISAVVTNNVSRGQSNDYMNNNNFD